jgi:Bax protein
VADASHKAALWRAALGVLCLDAAFACLIALAAHPPARSLEIRVALPAGPLSTDPVSTDPPARAVAASAPREIVVAIANAERAAPPLPAAPPPPPAVVRYVVTVPITDPAARPPDLAALIDGASLAVPTLRSNADRIAVAPTPESFTPEAAPRRTKLSSSADRLTETAAPIILLAESSDLDRGPVDRLEPQPAPAPVDDRQARGVGRAALASDRLIAAAPALALDDAPRRAIARADRLMTSAPRAAVLADETGWSASARGWSSEPLRPDLLPTARPSPAVLLAHWLPELSSPATTAELKTQFVRLLLPLVMQVNEDILQQRDRVSALAPRIDSGQPLSEADTRFVAELLQDVRLDGWDTDELLLRVDAVPLSMALAQAAQESGWGRSRPAREDNALFGQMMFAPAAHPQVQPFADLIETVTAYARNLNSHPAYAEFRRRRAALRARGDALDGHALVPFIERYSERGVGYVETIRQLMRMNNLFALDVRVLDAALGDRSLAGAPLDVPTLAGPILTDPTLGAPAPVGDGLAVDRLLADPLAAEDSAQGIDN